MEAFFSPKMPGIDSGQTGIIVNLAGSERGVDDGEGGGGITEGASQYPWLYVTNIQSSVKPNDVLQAAIVYRWKYVTILEVAMTSS